LKVELVRGVSLKSLASSAEAVGFATRPVKASLDKLAQQPLPLIAHWEGKSERIIQNNLKTIFKGRTTIIIAHRLSTIRNADLILVLDRGVLVESGTHDELIKTKGHYYYLNQQQLAHTG
jgi:ABC-type bacteriocin/lantibiotic exporter with double-glycine peptidase domain